MLVKIKRLRRTNLQLNLYPEENELEYEKEVITIKHE